MLCYLRRCLPPYFCSVDTKVAESAVLRQRELDHRFRSSPDLHAEAMHGMMFPIVVRSTAELK